MFLLEIGYCFDYYGVLITTELSILMYLIGISAVATFLLTYFSFFSMILLISPLLSFTSGFFPVVNSYLMDQWEVKGRGGKLGFYRSFLILLGSPASAFIGFFATHYGFDFAFLIISGILFLAAGLLFFSLMWLAKK